MWWRRKAQVRDLPPEVGSGTGRLGFVVVDEVMRADITECRLAGGVMIFRAWGTGPAHARNGEPTQMVVYGNDMTEVVRVRGSVVLHPVQAGQQFVFDVHVKATEQQPDW